MATISIILPTCNRLPFLHAAIASVFAQTFSDWDLVIADDGSDGETRDWLGSLGADPRAQVLLFGHRGSPAEMRNAAMAAARGRYLAFLDSDDRWLPDKLERQLAALRVRPECRWSYTAFRRIDAEGRPLAGDEQRPWTAHDGWIFEAVLRGAATICTPSVVVERALVEEAGGFDPAIRACEDIDLWLRLARVSPVAALDAPLVEVRVAAGSYSDRWAHALEDRGHALRKLLAAAPRQVAAVRAEYARNCAALAVDYLLAGRDADARRVRRECARHAWRHPSSWRAVMRLLWHTGRQRMLAWRELRTRVRRAAP
ncbi:MAG TPA: glycosyltransferase family A protein [Steroidobacteraceae bacterium]|nr:glycosyltransferase family A protein [Steroidobacteraceae bacterium]